VTLSKVTLIRERRYGREGWICDEWRKEGKMEKMGLRE
jgi:hypothetical protein